MSLPRPLALAAAAFLTALPAASQQAAQIDDPANLMGERVSPPALADTLSINHGAPALEQLLRKLRTRASMMLIVAHPDDEDSGLLTLESRGMGARVAMLTLTRGEGGQNLMSADFNDALGLIRTQELLAEDRYTGVDQFFGTEVDFGFSKTKEESFKKWTHERVLYDAVRCVRLYRPLVLASVFIGGVTDGHGQHQVSGEITQEVFLAAADPSVFPEMGLPPWAPLKVYARVPFAPVTPEGMYDYATGKFLPPHFHNYVTGVDTSAPPVASVVIHEGDKPDIPALNGMSYLQSARQGLTLQRSQIGVNFRPPPSGTADVGYTLMASRLRCAAGETDGKTGCPILPESELSQSWARGPQTLPSSEDSLFEGIDTTLFGIASLAPDANSTNHLFLQLTLQNIARTLDLAQVDFASDRGESVAESLRTALVLIDELLADIEKPGKWTLPREQMFNLLHELRIKRTQTNDAILLALHLALTAHTRPGSPRSDGSVVAGSRTPVQIEVDGLGPVHLRDAVLAGPQTAGLLQLLPPKTFDEPSHLQWESSFELPRDTPVTRPYFSRVDVEQPFYTVTDAGLRNAPATPAPLTCTAHLDFKGSRLELTRVLAAESTAHPVVIVPRLSLDISPTLAVTPLAKTPDTSLDLGVAVQTLASSAGSLTLEGPARWRLVPASIPFQAAPVGSRTNLHFSVTPGSSGEAEPGRVTASATSGDSHYTESVRPVGYPGLTFTNFYTPAAFRDVFVDVDTAPNLHIAYLPGTGDDVPAFLPSLGVTPTILRPSELTATNLGQYDAVLLGVRVYSAHPELSGTGSDPLTAYARQGGVVIAQYNSGGFNPASAPYPFSLPGDSAHNVVEEEQPVQILTPDSPLLTWPNRITSADFDRWIEERGHGFAADWAPEYTPLLEAHDVDQDPQKGGLLVASVGKGAYIYCAFALYRQLPEGVPGAYRLMANLLSYAKNPHR